MKEKQKARMLKRQIICNLFAVIILIVLLNFSILLYPEKGMQTRNNTIKFAWLGLTSYALVDDNLQFTSPIIVEKNKAVELEPGKYYWCVPFFKTCLKKVSFEIVSEVGISSRKLKEEKENATYFLENTGNVAEKIEIRNLLSRMITGFFILQPRAINVVEINESAEFIAEQK